MTYKLSADELPSELFAVTRERIRSGHGPVRVVPTEVVLANGEPWAIMGRPNGGGAPCLYSSFDLYATMEEARRAGLQIAHREGHMEDERHLQVMARLRSAAVLCNPGMDPQK